MAVLNTAARQVIESGALAHLVTINDDGSPQVSVVWVGLDGDELVAGHLDSRQRKVRNIHRDPRVAVTLEGSGANQIGAWLEAEGFTAEAALSVVHGFDVERALTDPSQERRGSIKSGAKGA